MPDRRTAAQFRQTSSLAVSIATLAVLSSCTAKVTGAGPRADGATPSDGGGPTRTDGVSMVSDAAVYNAGDGGPSTVLPPLPPLDNVTASVADDNVDVSFDPWDGAKDYRIYPLPANGDVHVDSTGYVTVSNATYRCAGEREALPIGDWVHTTVAGSVCNYTRTTAEATLGYVYTDPGPGRLPVYVLGDTQSDNSCQGERYAASRTKTYTTDKAMHDSLVAAGARDDGIQFYVPQASGAGTSQVYTVLGNTWDGMGFDNVAPLYFDSAAEVAARSGGGGPAPAAAFLVLSSPQPGTRPLMRVYYEGCGGWHDELAVGQDRFNRDVNQGDGPLWNLHWAGLTGPTTFVVEALDAKCPYQGHLAPSSLPASSPHPAYVTIDQMRAASTTGEVFINGQGASTDRPRAVARSFITVSPTAPPKMDWYAGFDSSGSFPALSQVGSSFQTVQLRSSAYEADFYSVDNNTPSGSLEYAIGPMLGELWVTYADWASDTNGKFRLTPLQNATLSSTAYLHVTEKVDIFSTGRRYPQILISTVQPPVQDNLASGTTVVVQPFSEWPYSGQIELCDHRTWDVNNQCPTADLEDPMASGNWPPIQPLGEREGVDRQAQLDVYASTSTVYLFVDGQPYGCSGLGSPGLPAGPVSVTFGDVLYHSGVDLAAYDVFHTTYMQTDTRRHLDNLGFSSGVAAPAWPATLPCAPMP